MCEQFVGRKGFGYLRRLPRLFRGSCLARQMRPNSDGLARSMNLKGMPHTIKIERRENELVVHLALLDGPHAKLPQGVLLHSEGWIDIGYGLRMFLVVGSASTTYRPPKLDEKRGFLSRLFLKKPEQPLLEAK